MRKIIHFFFAILLLTVTGPLPAQSPVADSLSALIRTDKADTNKVNHLNSLAIALWGNLDTAIICSNKALELARTIDWKKGIGRSKYLLGVFNFDKGNFSEALNYNSEAALIWQTLEENASGPEEQLYKLYRTKSIGEIGNAYYGLSNYPKALEYQFLALKLNQEMKREEGIAATCGNIGNIYSDQRDFPRALDYYKKSLKVSQKLGKLYDVSIDLRNIAILYSKMDDAAKSLEYSMMALATSRKLGNDLETANNMCSVGSAILSQADSARAQGKSYGELKDQYEKALDYFTQSVKLQEEQGNSFGMAMNYSNIAGILVVQKRYKEAEKYLLDALQLDSLLGSIFQIQMIHAGLSDLYSATGDYKRSLEHYKQSTYAKDSIFSEEKDKELTRHELNFEFEKKEAVMKAEQEKREALADADKKRQNIVILLVSIVALAIALIAVIVFRSLRLTRKQKQIIELQKELVEEKQREVLDSIHYAKRIQQSLLPTDKYISRSLERLKKDKK